MLEILPNISEWLDNNGKKVSRKTRLNTIRSKSQKIQEIYKQNSQNEELASWILEKEMIGYSYSTTLKKIFSKTRDDILDLEEFSNLEKNEKAVVILQVDEIHRSKSRKGNEYIKFISSDEKISNFRVLFCGRSLENYISENGKIPEEKDIVAVKLTKNDDKYSGFVEKLAIQTHKVYWKMSQIKDSDLESNQEDKINLLEPIKEINNQTELSLG